jgi:glycosyltransferase involved in cell wall biosynthesis
MMRLAVLTSHPIQYQAPLFRALAQAVDLTVYFAHEATASDQAAAGFEVAFTWDIDLLAGYRHVFLRNKASRPDPSGFFGCDTPEIATRLAQGRYDALLVSGWHLKSYWQGVLAARRLGISVLVRGDSQLEMPGGGLKRLAKSMIYPTMLRYFDVALYVGQRSRSYYEHYQFPKSRLFFAPHCVDNEWFAERATPAGRVALRNAHRIAPEVKVALFAGKLINRKRPLDLVRAVGKLVGEGRNLCVMVAGAGNLMHDVEREARALNVPLVLLGFCNQSQMPAAYAASDVLVLPSSERETWGLVANEALASGLPIIVSNACGCAPDLAQDQTAGRVFATGDIDGLADALRDLSDRPPPHTDISRKVQNYSITAAVDGICAALEATAVAAK